MAENMVGKTVYAVRQDFTGALVIESAIVKQVRKDGYKLDKQENYNYFNYRTIVDASLCGTTPAEALQIYVAEQIQMRDVHQQRVDACSRQIERVARMIRELEEEQADAT